MAEEINEVDQKLDGDIGSKKTDEIYLIRSQLSSTTRDVNKIVNRMNYRYLDHEKNQQTMEKQMRSNRKQQNKPTIVGKYNYYGKKYRFQQKQEELQIEPPNIQRLCCTEENQQNLLPPQQKISRTEQQIDCSKVPQPADSLFYDDGQIKFPSQNYYIYFDNQKDKASFKPAKKFETNIDNFKEQTVNKKFKPAWVMEKKINSLQREVKQLKNREKKMGATMESVLMQTGSSIKQHRRTVDFPLHIKSNLQKMVDSLWK